MLGCEETITPLDWLLARLVRPPPLLALLLLLLFPRRPRLRRRRLRRLLREPRVDVDTIEPNDTTLEATVEATVERVEAVLPVETCLREKGGGRRHAPEAHPSQ